MAQHAAPSTAARDRLVVTASALGTVFEWYDFFIYGTLADRIAGLFFPADNPAVSFLIFLGTFGVGFGMRPLGAVLFGFLGDRLGRKYTFLATIVLMGGATAGVGLLPTYAAIGVAAPVLLVLLRVLQGLALGGEYGGAAVYVAEHAPASRRGFYTSFVQAGVIGGFLLSLVVILATSTVLGEAAWAEWGWRVPFLFSVVLLAVSLWMRLKLHESPVFAQMKAEGDIARNPVRESFATRRNTGRILTVLFGIAAGLTVIWYTAQFQALSFLQGALRVEPTAARLIVGASAVINLFWFVLFGALSDRVGRKKPIVLGYALTLLLLFPIFHLIADRANPALAEATARTPVVVTGSDCRYDPFASKGQATPCGRVLDTISRLGVPYSTASASVGAAPTVTVGGRAAPSEPAALEAELRDRFPLERTTPNRGGVVSLILLLSVLGCLSGMTFGPVAALLVELFPARVRYTSLSIPYHVGTGYFGGFLPFIAQYVVARTGDPFAGLWYTFAVVAMALVVTALFLPETAGRALD
jgi:MFS family permease